MNQEIKDKWVAALRSGKYMQGVGALRRLGEKGVYYCCLGVLCDLAVKAGVIAEARLDPEDISDKYTYGLFDKDNLPWQVANWADLDSFNPEVCTDREGASLAEFNDCGFTFNQIADLIEENL